MDKSKFDIVKNAKRNGQKASELFNKTKAALVKAADQNGDGKFNKEDMSQIADVIKESAEEKAKQIELKILKPIFPQDIDAGDFLLSKFIRVTDRNGKRAESEVCKGSIGYFTNHKGYQLMNIFRDSIEIFGLAFYPDYRSEFYYVDPSDRDRYIALDDYFSYLKMVRVSELQGIAQDLGAKHFRITYLEEQAFFSKRSADLSVKAADIANVKAEHNFSEKKYSTIEIAAEMKCDGHAPVRPKLKYLLRDPSIQSLISMRMDKKSPLTYQKFMIKLSNSSGIKESDAVKIDAVLKSMKVVGNATVTSEAINESKRYLEYEIDF